MSVTPDFIGQIYKDTNTGNLWRANSTTPGDWTLEVQNLGYKWTPTSFNLGEKADFVVSTADAGLLTLVGLQTEMDEFPPDIEEQTSLLSIYFPNLTQVTGTGRGIFVFGCTSLQSVSFPLLETASGGTNGSLKIYQCVSLTTLSLPSLISTTGIIDFDGNTSLASLSLPSLISSGEMDLYDCSSLVSISLPVWVPTPGKDSYFGTNALNVASVDHILARHVASPTWGNAGEDLDLSGGTNAAPSNVGVGSDYAILVARGASVSKN